MRTFIEEFIEACSKLGIGPINFKASYNYPNAIIREAYVCNGNNSVYITVFEHLDNLSMRRGDSSETFPTYIKGKNAKEASNNLHQYLNQPIKDITL
jgi:hypothetical protein